MSEKESGPPIQRISFKDRLYVSLIPIANLIFLPLFKTWVAGASIESAITETRKLNAKGDEAVTIVNFLGEHYNQRWKVEQTVREYHDVIDRIAESGVQATVSTKPSQMGFDLPEDSLEYTQGSIRSIIERGSNKGVFVWIDMEHQGFTDFTIDIYRSYLKDFDNVGIVLQANMKRTDEDLRGLLKLDRSEYPHPAKIRLCKGIYKEPAEIAFTRKPEVNEHFGKLIRIMMEEGPDDIWAAVASHDDVYTDMGVELNKQHPKAHFEIQMLRGIRTSLANHYLSEGVPLAIYTPYGADSLPYCYRRATEANNLTSTMIRSIRTR